MPKITCSCNKCRKCKRREIMRRTRGERKVSIKKVDPYARDYAEAFQSLYFFGNMYDVFKYYNLLDDYDVSFNRKQQLKKDRESVEKEIKKQDLLNISLY